MATKRDRESEAHNNAEIRAVAAMQRYLAPLTLGERKRVLDWATKRFGSDEPEPDYDFVKKLMNATEEIGRQFGGMSHLDVMVALEAIVRQHRDTLKERDEETAATREP